MGHPQIAESWNVELVGRHDLDGHGDGMAVQVIDGRAYVGHMGEGRTGTSILDVSDPTSPQLLSQIETRPGTHSHKVQPTDDILVVNCERNKREPNATSWEAGLKIFDVSDCRQPRQVGFFETPGDGVHRMVYHAPYVFMSGTDEGYHERFLIIADLTDPSRPVEVGRWWMPGQHVAGGEDPYWKGGWRRFQHHHPAIVGDRAYCPWWDAGLVILDISDLERPSFISRLELGEDSRSTHTALPLDGHPLLAVVDEETFDDCEKPPTHVRVVDISDETAPRVVSRFPVPKGDFCSRGGRFGPHNLHEPRSWSKQGTERVYLTYFNAGLRIYDMADPLNPREEGFYVPEAPSDRPAIQLNDLTVTPDGLIYTTDRFTGGLYVLRFTG